MKTTIELPDDLLIEAKKAAAEHRCTFRELVERGLRRELARRKQSASKETKSIQWVTTPGGVPPGVDLRDRSTIYEHLFRRKT